VTDIRRKLNHFEKKVFKALQTAGLKPYISVVAISGSLYIKFNNPALRSLRVGNHDGRGKYKYKWNLRDDWKIISTEIDKYPRFYYPSQDYEEMIEDMKRFINV